MPRRCDGQRGFSLIEMMVVLAIVALAMGGVVFSFRALGKSNAKSVAGQLSAAIRYTYDRAVTTGSYYRIVIDLNGHAYWAEKSDDRFYLVRGKEDGPGKGLAPDEELREKKRLEEEAKQKVQVSGIAAQLQPPPVPKRAKFQSFKDSTLPRVELGDVRVRDVYTARQQEAYTEGKAYLYFFPDGHTERAMLHITDRTGDVYTLVVHPLTGRVEIKDCDIAPPRDFEQDEEGREAPPR